MNLVVCDWKRSTRRRCWSPGVRQLKPKGAASSVVTESSTRRPRSTAARRCRKRHRRLERRQRRTSSTCLTQARGRRRSPGCWLVPCTSSRSLLSVARASVNAADLDESLPRDKVGIKSILLVFYCCCAFRPLFVGGAGGLCFMSARVHSWWFFRDIWCVCIDGCYQHFVVSATWDEDELITIRGQKVKGQSYSVTKYAKQRAESQRSLRSSHVFHTVSECCFVLHALLRYRNSCQWCQLLKSLSLCWFLSFKFLWTSQQWHCLT